MRILVIALFALLVFSAKLSAQDINKNFSPQFGIKLGMNASRINFTHSGAPELPQTSWTTGIVVGAFVAIPIFRKLSLQPEYLFSKMGAKLDNDTAYQLNYLSLPVLLKLKVAKSLSLVGGGTFDLLLWANEKPGQSKDMTEEVEARNIGITGGVEWQASKSFGLITRYMGGINHVDEILKFREFKNQSFQIAAFLRF